MTPSREVSQLRKRQAGSVWPVTLVLHPREAWAIPGARMTLLGSLGTQRIEGLVLALEPIIGRLEDSRRALPLSVSLNRQIKVPQGLNACVTDLRCSF